DAAAGGEHEPEAQGDGQQVRVTAQELTRHERGLPSRPRPRAGSPRPSTGECGGVKVEPSHSGPAAKAVQEKTSARALRGGGGIAAALNTSRGTPPRPHGPGAKRRVSRQRAKPAA